MIHIDSESTPTDSQFTIDRCGKKCREAIGQNAAEIKLTGATKDTVANDCNMDSEGATEWFRNFDQKISKP